jgi:hypothetical protein
MYLPNELSDDIVPEHTTVVGDIDYFFEVYVKYGYAFREWKERVKEGRQLCKLEYEKFLFEAIREFYTR